MYQFTEAEFAALEAATDGTLVSGTAEYQAAIDAIAATANYGPNVPGSIPPDDILGIIVGENVNKPWATFYVLAAQFAEQGGTAADNNTIEWLRGAAGVNRGDTAAANFIRGYTAAQIDARSGQTITDTQLQYASDNIAEDVLSNIINNGFILPTITEIGQNDVGGTIDALDSFGLPNDFAIWSGNLLFPGLGDASFFLQNFLENAGDTYDLFTAAYATQTAGYSDFLLAGASSPFALFANASQIDIAIQAATTFLSDAYAFDGFSLARGLGLSNVIVGQDTSDDLLIGTSERDFIHGGGGNDTILLSLSSDSILNSGSDLIDGGAGYDRLVLPNSLLEMSHTVILRSGYDGSRYTTTATYSADIYLDGDTSDATYAYNAERIELGNKSDFLIIEDFTGLESIDGGQNVDGLGDTIEVSALDTGVTIFLTDGNITSDSNALIATNFENVIGTDQGDMIFGNSENNVIDGGGGDDTLDGGAGNDLLSFESSEVGVDVQLTSEGVSGASVDGDTITNFEGLIGTDFNDTLGASNLENGLSVLVGGEGEDRLVQLNEPSDFSGDLPLGDLPDINPVVMIGGAGADTFQLVAGSGILVVQTNLEDDEFSNFSLEALGLSIDWSQISAVLVDTDAADTIELEYPVYGDQGVEISSELVTLDVGNYGDINPDFTSHDYMSFLTPYFDGTGFVTSEFVWSGDASFLGGLYQGQGNWANFEGIPVPEIDGQEDGIFPSGDWFMIGGQMNGTTILPNGTGGANPAPGIENLEPTGTSGFNFNFGSSLNELRQGGAGDEWFIASGGADTIDGGAGFDRISYGASQSAVSVDLASGTSSGDFADSDVISNIENISGSAFNDLLIGSDTANILSGGDGNDSIDGGAGNDRLEGGSGNDLLTGGLGHDVFAVYDGGDSDVIIDFDTGADVLTINGEIVHPALDVSDVMFEQVGMDVVVSYGFFDGGTVRLAGIDLQNWTDTGHIRGTGADDRLFGTDGSDTIDGGAGKDTIWAGDGDDLIIYTSGDDRIRGGPDNLGIDTLDMVAFVASEVVFSWGGTDVIISTSAGDITLEDQLLNGGFGTLNIENLIFSDTVLSQSEVLERIISDQATAGDDVISGRDSDDYLLTLEGDDFVSGGLGDDTIVYHSGNDTINGDAGTDTLELSTYLASDIQIITDGTNVTLSTPSGTLTLFNQMTGGGVEVIELSDATWSQADIVSMAVASQSSPGDDLIFGSDGDDLISGLAGNDTIISREGNDTMVGGQGDDVFRYERGNDVIIAGQGDVGFDILDLSQFARNEITLNRVGSDIIVSTALGSIVLQDQLLESDENTHHIDSIILSDTALTAQDILDTPIDLNITHMTTSVVPTGIQEIDGILASRSWVENVIYYSFPENSSEYGYGFERSTLVEISTAQQMAAHFGMSSSEGLNGFAIESFANIDLEYSAADGAHIRLAGSNTPPTAYAFLPENAERGGDIWFGTDHDFTDPTAGNYEWIVMLHEIGHAMGLSHGHEGNFFGTLPVEYDTMEYSIMTYRDYFNSDINAWNNEEFGFAQTFMMLDIAALQSLYGANYNANSGDTVYSWSPNSGDTFINGEAAITPGENRIFATIWDGNGNDTYDLSAYNAGISIDLTPGRASVFSQDQLSELGDGNYAGGNIYNARLYDNDLSSLIENAIGGTGGDSILGNVGNNRLEGNAGDDSLDGGLGADTLFGAIGDDTITGGGGDDSLDGGDGFDTFYFSAGDGSDVISSFNHIEDEIFFDGSLFDLAADLFDVAYEMVSSDLVFTYGNGLDSLTLLDFDLALWSEDPAMSVVDGSAGNDRIDVNYFDADGDGVSDQGQTIFAGDGKDQIYDGVGDDVVNGEGGRDRFFAGAGADEYYGGDDRDEIFYTRSTEGLVIDMTDASNSTGIAFGDTFDSVEYVHGSDFDDIIIANNDLVRGRAGNDLIQDTDGVQRLYGDSGVDTFRFIDNDGDRDRVSDFTINEDIIDLSLWGVTSITDTGLLIEERTNGQGTLQGDLVITFNGNNNYVRLDGLDFSDIAALDSSHFIFA